MSKVSCKLEDLIIYISRGITPKYTEKSDNSCIVLNQKCIRDFSINFNPSRKNDISLKKISDEKFIEQYDVLINSTGVGTLGRVAQFLGNAPNSITVDSHITIVRPDANKIHPLFFGYLLKSKQSEIESFAQGTTGQTELSRDDLKNMVVEFTNNKELQIKHSEFLLNIDQKIHLNTQTNQTLEAIAQVIFKSWFVDFDPVRAKAAVLSEGKSEHEANLAAMLVICGKDTSELNDTEYKALWQIAEAFPSELVENEQFGEVPKEWENTTLSEICSMQNGYAFKSNEWTDSGIPVIKIGSVKPMIVDIESNGFVSEENEHIRSDFLLKQGDIVVGLTGYVGEVGRIPAGDKAMLNQRVAKFVPKKLDRELSYYNFVYCLARQRTFKEYAELNAKGSAQANISTRELLNYPICLASLEVHKFFEIKINELLYKILTNSQESKVLEKTRGLLLPKLLSGEIHL
ncbi:restriction endonuclease subunit S [Mannheimia haemolytica]|uniref:restriction endonuclease subunit S n=1 Tax=Mannheimia haemolytica TaxID=75985 RepID=UPI002EB6497C|nr:restriction endonuclease subunit S [Mannheimia haemolytica]